MRGLMRAAAPRLLAFLAMFGACHPALPVQLPVTTLPQDHPQGATRLLLCPEREGSLGMGVAKAGGAEVEVRLSPRLAMVDGDHVRFVDVDHDGLPDAIIDRGSTAREPAGNTMRFAVYLTSQLDGRGAPCTEVALPDPGSDGFLASATSVDEATHRLAQLPRRGVTEKEACEAFDNPRSVNASRYGFELARGRASQLVWPVSSSAFGAALISCTDAGARSPLGGVFECDSWRPYCEFGMTFDNSRAAMLRRYWFGWDAADAGNRLYVVAVGMAVLP